jgi:hypothetical protein
MATKTRPHVLSITLTSEELYLFQELAKERDRQVRQEERVTEPNPLTRATPLAISN